MDRSRRPLITAAAVALLVTGGVLLAARATDRLDGLLGIGRAVDVPSELYAINADGTGRVRLTAEPGLMHWGPAWSPDGRTLAYTRGEPGRHAGQLVLTAADGGGQRALTADARNNYLPAWSPDGSRLAYVSQAGAATATAELMLIGIDGGNPARLTTNDVWEHSASWSPDGRRLAFGSRRDGTWRVYLMDADGADPRPLPGTERGNAPSWSPDGRWIAFTSDRTGNDNIYVVATDGGVARRLTTGDRHHDNAAWSPNGDRLAFAADRDGAEDIYVMDADGGNLRNLTRTPGLSEQIPAWSPDGTRLAFTALEPVRGGLWPVPALRALGLGLAGGLATVAALLIRRGSTAAAP